MCSEDYIDDEEWLYRSFRVPDPCQNDAIHYKEIDGVLRISRGAWNDKNCQPSVDRKKLVSTPADVQFHKEDAVIQIQAKEVRAITSNTNRQHNVVFDKTELRPAHALITSSPPYASKPSAEKAKWREFQILLGLAASKHGWVIEPQND